MKFRLITLVVILSMASILSSQGLTPMKIAGVEVEGNNITTATVVKYTSGIVEGKEFVPGDFGKSVKKLWATGFFSDIQIRLDKEAQEGLYITIIVEEAPILGEVSFKGDKKKRREIEEELDLKKGQRIRPPKHIPLLNLGIFQLLPKFPVFKCLIVVKPYVPDLHLIFYLNIESEIPHVIYGAFGKGCINFRMKVSVPSQ